MEHDENLEPDLFRFDWWLQLDDEQKTMYKQILVPDASAPRTSLLVERSDPRGWCSVIPCVGMAWNGRRSCKSNNGPCFADSVAFARKLGKPPLCRACVEHVRARRGA